MEFISIICKTSEYDKKSSLAITIMLTLFIENNFACDKFGDAIRLASIDNRRSKARRAPEDAFIHIRGEEQTGRRSGSTIACLIPDAFVTTRAPPGTQVPTRFPNETALPCTKPREADTSPRPPLSRHHPRFMRVRANLCVLRKTCMAPASPPTACNMWDRTQRT